MAIHQRDRYTNHSGAVETADAANAFAAYIILHSIEPLMTQRLYQGKTETEKEALSKGKELWKSIKKFCTEQNTGSSLTAAYDKFTTFVYDDSAPVEENLARFESIYYTIEISGTTIPEKLIISLLLRSLKGDEWHSFKSSVSGNPPTTYSDLKTRILREVLQRQAEKKSVEEVTALMATTNVGRGRGRQGSRPTFQFGVLPPP